METEEKEERERVDRVEAIPEIHLEPGRRVEDPHRREKERKRARDDDDDYKEVDTPQQQTQTKKRKKIRGKVAGDAYTRKSAVKKASATATPAPAANDSYARPKRSCRRSLAFNSDVEEEDQQTHKRRRSSIVTTSLQNLLSEMQPSLWRKKRSKRDPIASKLNARALHLQWRRHNATGPSDEELWERKLSIDSVTKLFKELDITRDPCLPHCRETALLLQQETFKRQKLLYTKDGSVIPYPDGKKHQPKVQLDVESTRGEERNMLQERAHSFITRMRLVQGDRRFSPWKGSVIDSVVGVFLTQNVADHSSSSVFMDIAAEFPNPGNAVAAPRRKHNPSGIVIDEIDDDEVLFEVESCDEFRNNVDETKNRKKPSPGQPSKKKKGKKSDFDWDSLRRQAEARGQTRERTERTMDAVDWESVRCTNVNKIADLIKKRGMHDMLSLRIKAFLNRMVKDHGQIDLEWLRYALPDEAKEYLLSINGLGLKSVECVRLLSLHQTAFPVDTNVGRIAVRLGWVPLQPLPDELQMHLLELYPVLASVQKYLWPRLCKLDQKTLYELHYHMITFGKVFCTKKKPNCQACPMKAECQHYASARASAQLALPDAEEVTIHERRPKLEPVVVNFQQSLYLTRDEEPEEGQSSRGCEPIIEEPATPEPPECPDIEDYPWNNEDGISTDPWENKDVIPTIIIGNKKDGFSTVFEVGTSTDLVVLSNKTTPIPRHKLKTKERLRTEHLVYELPDSHPILRGFDPRDPDDTFPYLFALWSPEKTCFPWNSKTVRGTILIPCRTAMRGRFPLNGTYFQMNEVFADHGSSINPIYVRRESLRSLRRALVYSGSSVSACFGGLSMEAIQYGFWRGYVCVRGFDPRTRKSKPLVKKLHCTPNKKEQAGDE